MRTPFYEIEIHPSGAWAVHHIHPENSTRHIAVGKAPTPAEAEATAREWVENRKRAENSLKAYEKRYQRIRIPG